jgi:hypothetical protein
VEGGNTFVKMIMPFSSSTSVMPLGPLGLHIFFTFAANLIVPVGSGFARVSSKTFRSTALTSCGLFAVWNCYFKHLRSLYNKACIIHELPEIRSLCNWN